MNYYEHHLGDYTRDAAHLSMVEDGAYRRLIDAYYVREAPIPAELKDACRLVRATSKPERDAVQAVLHEFFELGESGWRHKRCDAEIERFQDKQAKAKRSADARWNAHRTLSDGNANASKTHDAAAMRTHSEGNALQSPVTSNQSPKNPSGSTPDKPAKPARGSKRVPADFSVTDAMRTWAVTEAPHADLERETAKFRDWEFAHARTDWPATWRTWLRKASDNALEKRGKTGSAPFQTDRQRRMAEAVPGLANYRSRTADDERTIDMEASHGALT